MNNFYYLQNNVYPYSYFQDQYGYTLSPQMLKSGGKTQEQPKIKIKKQNRGKFTDYCGGTVTGECIARAKASGNPTLVKRAVFAQNVRKWKHKKGGIINVHSTKIIPGVTDTNPNLDNMKGDYKSKKLIKKHFTGGNIAYTKDPRANNAISIYNDFVQKGIPDQAALELTNQKVAEGGWSGYSTGDGRRFSNPDQFTQHVIDWHQKMYPDTLNVKNFNQFYNGLENGRYKYNKNVKGYKQQLLLTRPGVLKRINSYRSSLGQSPLSMVETENNNLV